MKCNVCGQQDYLEFGKQHDWRITSAYDEAVKLGQLNEADYGPDYPKSWNYKKGIYQVVWRNGSVDLEFDYQKVTTAILDALVYQGGMVAWDGDGVSCVTQMVQAAYQRRDYWRKRALAAEAKPQSRYCQKARCTYCWKFPCEHANETHEFKSGTTCCDKPMEKTVTTNAGLVHVCESCSHTRFVPYEPR